MLDLLNKVLVRVQRRIGGIPRGAAHLYDKVAAKYLEPSYDYVVEEVVSKGARKILDVGCGPGKLLLEIAEETDSVILVGLDVSKAMARIARKNALGKGLYGAVDFVVADAHKMPLRDNCLDLIVSTGTLHHIRNPREVFSECTRVLKIGCEAWIYEFSHDASWSECSSTAKRLGRLTLLIKVAASLHGLPRKVYREGYVKEELLKSGVSYKVVYEGAVTKLVLTA